MEQCWLTEPERRPSFTEVATCLRCMLIVGELGRGRQRCADLGGPPRRRHDVGRPARRHTLWAIALAPTWRRRGSMKHSACVMLSNAGLLLPT
uniref:Uncharacterized protein n=1 Tax=Aegilops tauschii subsp. strangulata TaxID=200361 RepID=A0A453LVS2_AEGTS